MSHTITIPETVGSAVGGAVARRLRVERQALEADLPLAKKREGETLTRDKVDQHPWPLMHTTISLIVLQRPRASIRSVSEFKAIGSIAENNGAGGVFVFRPRRHR